MKAYQVSADDAEVWEVVIADSPGKAKSYAMSGDQFHSYVYHELSAKRFPEADFLVNTGPGIVQMSPEFARFLRKQGWNEVESYETCTTCGLYEWSIVPESSLDEDGRCGS